MEHINYDNTKLHKALADNTVFVTSLRHPLSHLKSDLNYKYAKSGHKNNNNNINLLAIYLNKSSISFHDLNFKYHDTGVQYVSVPKHLTVDPQEMHSFIRTNLSTLFKTVLITEHFDESLVLLRRNLCWDLEDIMYIAMKPGNYTYKTKSHPKEFNEQYKKLMVSVTQTHTHTHTHTLTHTHSHTHTHTHTHSHSHTHTHTHTLTHTLTHTHTHILTHFFNILASGICDVQLFQRFSVATN